MVDYIDVRYTNGSLLDLGIFGERVKPGVDPDGAEPRTLHRSPNVDLVTVHSRIGLRAEAFS